MSQTACEYLAPVAVDVHLGVGGDDRQNSARSDHRFFPVGSPSLLRGSRVQGRLHPRRCHCHRPARPETFVPQSTDGAPALLARDFLEDNPRRPTSSLELEASGDGPSSHFAFVGQTGPLQSRGDGSRPHFQTGATEPYGRTDRKVLRVSRVRSRVASLSSFATWRPCVLLPRRCHAGRFQAERDGKTRFEAPIPNLRDHSGIGASSRCASGLSEVSRKGFESRWGRSFWFPRWLENDLRTAPDILRKSIDLALQIFEDVRVFAKDKGIPLDVNVESVSIRKEEIEASGELFEALSARM
jgi:hypothetical protein